MPEPISISALQHYLFCPRQCALIHVDGLWAESALTVEGQRLHRHVDRPGRRTRPESASQRGSFDSQSSPSISRRIARAVPLISERLGLTGKADLVEFSLASDGSPAGSPRPVEHKRGRPKRIDADRVQLCAQALCLEEMFNLAPGAIRDGDLFYHATRHREVVRFTAELRTATTTTIEAVRAMIEANIVPRVPRAAKCRSCSLLNLCLPAGTEPSRTPRLYLARSLAAALDERLTEAPQPPQSSDSPTSHPTQP